MDSTKDNPEVGPLASVALCTCNGEAYLAAQMESLISQDHANVEIVVVDDASTDATMEILQAYAGKHPQIKLQRNEERLGYVANFQKCLQLCQGEFIALCDQDDVWYAHKLSTMLAAIGDHALAYSRVRVVDSGGQALDREHPKRKLLSGRCPLALVLTNFVTGHASMIRRDLLRLALPVPKGHIHDQWLAFCAAATGSGIVLVDEVLSDYRLHGNNQVLGSGKRRAKRPDPAYLEAFAKHAGLSQQEALLIRQLSALMSRRFTLYNLKLHRFLKTHADAFLAAYERPAAARRRSCMRHSPRDKKH